MGFRGFHRDGEMGVNVAVVSEVFREVLGFDKPLVWESSTDCLLNLALDGVPGEAGARGHPQLPPNSIAESLKRCSCRAIAA
jgi:hypothetical protein